jgi:hypothetical protein
MTAAIAIVVRAPEMITDARGKPERAVATT